MYQRGLFLLLFLAMATVTKQANDIAPTPDLNFHVLSVQVKEREDRRTNLNGGDPVLTCTDDDDVRVGITSVSPSSPCGDACFQLQPCGAPIDFCLFFLPSEGSLSFVAASSYTLSITCTDDVELAPQGTLTVTVEPNTPPQFVPSAPLREAMTVNGLSGTANQEILTVATMDVDDDPVTYTLTLNPFTEFIYIGRNNGILRFAQNARLICESSVQASVTITDGFSGEIGPKIYDLTINGNLAPVLTNLGGTIQVPENTAAGSTVFTLARTDALALSPDAAVIQMTSPSNEALELYELKDLDVRLRVSPDYERATTRSLQLSFQAHDGYCFSDTGTLTIEITNVNEPPEYQPPAPRVVLFVYEGVVNVGTGQTAFDEDDGETLTHTLVSVSPGNMGDFGVDPTSGQIFSLNEIDIDPNREFWNYNVAIRVTDSQGLTDDQLVVVQVRDVNDQAPTFQQNSYTFAATECSMLGDVLGTVAGSDADSAFQNNNVFYFGGSSGTTAVTSGGQVVLSSPMVNGDSNTGSATITDVGLFPGPLSGTPVPYIVTCCAPCPTTAAPNTGGGGGGTGGTTGGTGGSTTAGTGGGNTLDTANAASGFEDALPWVVPAMIFGLLWLALTGYLIYRFCCPCKNPCPRRPKPIKVKPQPQPRAQLPPKVGMPPKPPTPRPAFKIDPPPPQTPEPEPQPYILPFWTEKYTNQRHVHQPDRFSKPISIEQLPDEGNHDAPPPDLCLGPDKKTGPAWHAPALNADAKPDAPPPPNQAWTAPKKKSKFCVIL